MVVAVLERPVVKTALTERPKAEHFTVLGVGRTLTGSVTAQVVNQRKGIYRIVDTHRRYIRIRSGGFRGSMYAYLLQLVAEGKASIKANHKSTVYDATIWLAEDESATKVLKLLRLLATTQAISLSTKL